MGISIANFPKRSVGLIAALVGFAGLGGRALAAEGMAEPVDAPVATARFAENAAQATVQPVRIDVPPVITVAPAIPQYNLGYNLGPSAALLNLTQILAGPNNVIRNAQSISSIVTALNVSLAATEGTFTGSMATEDNPRLVMAENLLVAKAESTFRLDALAAGSAFRDPENRANRPAGPYQIGAIEFTAALAAHKDDLKLSPELAQSFAPVFGTLDAMAQAQARRSGRTPDAVRNNAGQMGEAFKRATQAQKEMVRRARIDPTPVLNGTTTRGAMLSTIAKLYIADSAISAPPGLVERYGHATLRYTEHVFGKGGALAITGMRPDAVSTRWLNMALKANPIAPSRGSIMDTIKRKKFGQLNEVARALMPLVP